jgi:ribosomal protein S18 acetylase RimI-like enzyme
LASEVFKADGKRLVLRSPKQGDSARFRRYTNALAREKKTNPDLAIIDPSDEMTAAEAKQRVARIIKGIALKNIVGVWAFDDDDLVGACEVYRPKQQEVRHTGLLDIAVLSGYRGIGLGESMLTETLERSKAIGIRLVELRVFSNNLAAIRLYEKVGFTTSGRVPKMILKNGRYVDDVQMYINIWDQVQKSG